MTEENKNNTSIIPIGSTGLVRADNSINITNKILHENNERFEFYFNEGIDLLFQRENRLNYAILSLDEFEGKFAYWGMHRLDYSVIIDMFNKSIKLNPNFSLSYVYRGVGNGQSNRALIDFDLAININPNMVIANYFKADVYRYFKLDFYEAIKYYQLVIDLRKTSKLAIKAYESIGQIFDRNLNNIENAIQYYSIALEIDNEELSILKSRSSAYFKLDKLELALKDLNNAIGINSNLYSYFGLRSEVKNALGDKVGANQDNQIYNNWLKTLR